jgi:5-(carboxyamino)imidazole ribonucleotide synthase
VSGSDGLSAPLAPGATIGILGGGQLGRMLVLAASRLGFKCHVYSDETESCAFYVADETTRAQYSDARALEKFAAQCDVVTFEFENVPDATARFLSERVPVAPNARSLAIAQDRFLEKSFIAELGIATAGFRQVVNEVEASSGYRALAGSSQGPKAVLKTQRLGYDGKGQRLVNSEAEAVAGFKEFGRVPCILETFVEFAYEASVIGVRARDGRFAAYDPPRNEHENHILRRSTVPSPLSWDKTKDAITITSLIAEKLDYVGVLGVELFVTRNHGLMVNELAPRVHNSGHWTIEACVTSQFENHIRAVAGWPLGDTARHSDAVMENIIGDEVYQWRALAQQRSGLHIYGKRVSRPGRKMGHITRLAPLGSVKA